MDWDLMFIPDVPVLEIIVRGSVTYITLFFMMRVLLKRQSGNVGRSDLLLLVLIADASQNAMAGEYRSITNGLILVGTIMFWTFAFDWLSYKSPWFNRLIEPEPLPLIENGKMLRRNMRRELISEDELMGELRQQGLNDLEKVKRAYIESTGRISIIQQEEKHHKKAERQNK